MLKNIDDLNRFDFTSECKTCQYRKELGVMEYCCQFVYDLLISDRMKTLREQVESYTDFDDELNKMDKDNVFFSDDVEYSVTVTFKTNLRKDKKLILSEIRKSLLDSQYFNSVNLVKDTLYRQEYNNDRELVNSTLDEYLTNKGGGIV